MPLSIINWIQSILIDIKWASSVKEKIEKNSAYEVHVSNYHMTLGYTVWEYGKELGVKNYGIDIIVKQERKVLFLQCKHWNKSNKYKITYKHLKSIRQDIFDYIAKDVYLFYIWYWSYLCCLEDISDKSAYYYLDEYKESIKAKIIPFRLGAISVLYLNPKS